MPIFINGEAVNIPLAELVAQGKRIIEQENIPPATSLDLDLWAGSVAVSRYDEAYREWLETNGDEHIWAIRSQAREHVRSLRASIEAKRIT